MASQPILQESFFSFISIHTKFTLGSGAYDTANPPEIWGTLHIIYKPQPLTYNQHFLYSENSDGQGRSHVVKYKVWSVASNYDAISTRVTLLPDAPV